MKVSFPVKLSNCLKQTVCENVYLNFKGSYKIDTYVSGKTYCSDNPWHFMNFLTPRLVLLLSAKTMFINFLGLVYTLQSFNHERQIGTFNYP